MPFWFFYSPGIIIISFMAPVTGPWWQCVLLASQWLIHSLGILSFPPWCIKQGQCHIGWCWLFHPPGITTWFWMHTFLSSIQVEAFPSDDILYHWFWSQRLVLPFHWNMDKSLDTALSCYAQQTGYLLTSLHHWLLVILSKLFPTIFVSPFGFVIF